MASGAPCEDVCAHNLPPSLVRLLTLQEYVRSREQALAAARHLHGLGAAPKQIPVWVRRRSWRESHAGFDVSRGERRGIGLLPRTCVEDTVLDLGSTLTVDDLCRLSADACLFER